MRAIDAEPGRRATVSLGGTEEVVGTIRAGGTYTIIVDWIEVVDEDGKTHRLESLRGTEAEPSPLPLDVTYLDGERVDPPAL